MTKFDKHRHLTNENEQNLREKAKLVRYLRNNLKDDSSGQEL